MNIREHLDHARLHHAYLVEAGDEVLSEIFAFWHDAEVAHLEADSFKIEDARNLKSLAVEKSASGAKKIYIISANRILLEAQQAMLKLFEEPIAGTHFFVITPDAGSLLPTFISRFYFIRRTGDKNQDAAKQFLQMPPARRIDFIKETLLSEDEDTKNKALKFLNSLESSLHSQMSRTVLDPEVFHHIFQVRRFLRMPGSSAKNLMESVALNVPTIKL